MSEKVYLVGDHNIGLDMPDGAKYDRVRGQNFVNVSDEHAETLRRHTGFKVGERFVAEPATPEKVCTACGFRQYLALAGNECRKCGGAWE